MFESPYHASQGALGRPSVTCDSTYILVKLVVEDLPAIISSTFSYSLRACKLTRRPHLDLHYLHLVRHCPNINPRLPHPPTRHYQEDHHSHSTDGLGYVGLRRGSVAQSSAETALVIFALAPVLVLSSTPTSTRPAQMDIKTVAIDLYSPVLETCQRTWRPARSRYVCASSVGHHSCQSDADYDRY